MAGVKKILLILILSISLLSISFYGGHQLAYDHAIYNADAVLLEMFEINTSQIIMFNTFMVVDKYKFFGHIYNQFRIWFNWNLDEVSGETIVIENNKRSDDTGGRISQGC